MYCNSSYIEYKNNELEGKFEVCDIQSIHINKDDKGLHQKLVLEFKSSESVTIDMDEMELEDFYESIDEYIAEHYKSLLK